MATAHSHHLSLRQPEPGRAKQKPTSLESNNSHGKGAQPASQTPFLHQYNLSTALTVAQGSSHYVVDQNSTTDHNQKNKPRNKQGTDLYIYKAGCSALAMALWSGKSTWKRIRSPSLGLNETTEIREKRTLWTLIRVMDILERTLWVGD